MFDDNKILNTHEESYMNKRIFKNTNEQAIYYIKKYMQIDNYEYDITELNNKLISNNLNIEVNNTVEAIKAINKNNLFKYLSLTANKDNIENLELPLYVIVKTIYKESLQRELDKLDSDNIKYRNIIYKSNNIDAKYQIFALVDSYYSISYLKEPDEYIIAIYSNDNSDSAFKQFNFIELYSILANITLKEAVIHLIKLLNIKVKAIQQYINIYYANLEILNNTKVLAKYNYFYKKAKSHVYLLEELNKLSILECYFQVSKNNMGYIYCSLRYFTKIILKDRIKFNTVSSYLNAFNLMGFCRKVLVDENNNSYNNTTIYQINTIDEELLTNANEVAKLIFNNNKSLSDIDRKYIIENYGIGVANTIIPVRNNNLKGGGICA